MALETGRTVVFPWHCDHYNHMNTRHYLGMFDDAGAHMMLQLGYSLETDAASGIGWADVEQTIRYRCEVSCGALLGITSMPIALGRKTIRYRHSMTNLTSGQDVASLDGVVVCFDLGARRARALPDKIAAACRALGAVDESRG